MNKDFKKELAGFEAVWQRVEQGREKTPEGVKLTPKEPENRRREV